MDLLEQLKQQNPEKFREQKPAPMTDAYGREYSGMVAFVIRLSGGKIQNTKQASYVLLVTAGVIVLATILVFFSNSLGSNKIQGHPLTPALPTDTIVR